MISIKVTADIKPALRYLANVQKQARFAASRALNATAKAVQAELVREVDRVFDRPTRYTRTAFGVKFSNKADLRAEIYVKPGREYLLHQIHGGKRGLKRFEERLKGETTGETTGYYAPGAGARLNVAGNMSRQQIVAITNKLKARGQSVFAGAVRGRFGIWERTKRRGLKALLVEIPEPRYSKRLPFYETGKRVIEREWQRQFALAFEAAMRSAR